MAHNHSATNATATPGWSTYYDKAGLRPPRPTMLRALASLEAEGIARGHAIDLGCGIGRDALELLRRGWRVTGIDQEEEALTRLTAEAAARGLPAPAPVRARFETAALPRAHLINASFALFFCRAATFLDLWRRIRTALLSRGRFAGQLLGPNDSWAGDRATSCTPAALTALLGGYAVEWLEREETDSVTPRGEAKHWDIWHLVLRRPDD